MLHARCGGRPRTGGVCGVRRDRPGAARAYFQPLSARAHRCMLRRPRCARSRRWHARAARGL